MIARRGGRPDRQEVVLIVDDEPRNIDLLKAMLAPDGLVFLSAESGSEALTILTEHSPDLIILDVMVRGMAGHELVRTIKADSAMSNIPVIMITALDDRKSRLTSLDAGAEDFLTKPVDRADLRTRVRNLLRLKALSDHVDKYGQGFESEVRSRTQRLLASEMALRVERDRAQQCLDTSEAFLLALDLEGRITLANRRACTMLGWDVADLIGSSWSNHLPGRIREDVRASLQRLVTDPSSRLGNGVPSSTADHPVTDRAGSEHMLEWRNFILRDEKGDVTGTFSSGTDITARSRGTELAS